MKTDYKKLNDLYYKSKVLREFSTDNRLPYEKQMELRKQQDDIYKKHKFLKGLSKAKNKMKRGDYNR